MPTKRKKRATSVKGTSGCSTPQSLSSTVTVQSNTLSNTLKASPPFKLRLSSGSLKKPRHCDPVSDGDDNESDINITDDTSGGGGGGSGGGGGGGDGGGVAIAKVEEEEDDTHRILMEKILTLQTDNESLTELNSIIKNELKKQGELVESLKKSSTKTQPTGTTTNTTAANEVIALHEQLQALRDQTRIDQTRLENEKTTLKAEIANLTADKDDKNIIEKALLALQEEKNSFKNKLQTTQQQLTDCKVAREKDNDSVEKLRKHQLMVDLKSSNENLRLKLEAANKTIEELRQEKETREKQDDHTTQVCTSSSDSPSPVEVSNTKGDEAVALELKKGDLHVAVNNLQSQAATAKQTKSGLEDEVAMLADKKLSLETALGHLRETKELSEREIKRLKQQQDKLSEQHVSMLLEVEKLGESRKELSRNIKNARAAPNFQQNQHQHQHQQQQQQQQHKQKGYKAGARNAANRSSTIPVPHPVPTREERSIFVIRHGERADETKGWKDASRPYDTPITPYGMKEAATAATEIKKRLSSDRCLLVSSPYRRCIETACEILKLFPASELLVHHGFGEMKQERLVGKNNPTFPDQGYTVAIDGSQQPSFPETLNTAAERSKQAFSRIAREPEYLPYNIIIITHGDVVNFCSTKTVYNVETTGFVQLSIQGNGTPKYKSSYRVSALQT